MRWTMINENRTRICQSWILTDYICVRTYSLCWIMLNWLMPILDRICPFMGIWSSYSQRISLVEISDFNFWFYPCFIIMWIVRRKIISWITIPTFTVTLWDGLWSMKVTPEYVNFEFRETISVFGHTVCVELWWIDWCPYWTEYVL